jgi:hypothetical protein
VRQGTTIGQTEDSPEGNAAERMQASAKER